MQEQVQVQEQEEGREQVHEALVHASPTAPSQKALPLRAGGQTEQTDSVPLSSFDRRWVGSGTFYGGEPRSRDNDNDNYNARPPSPRLSTSAITLTEQAEEEKEKEKGGGGGDSSPPRLPGRARAAAAGRRPGPARGGSRKPSRAAPRNRGPAGAPGAAPRRGRRAGRPGGATDPSAPAPAGTTRGGGRHVQQLQGQGHRCVPSARPEFRPPPPPRPSPRAPGPRLWLATCRRA